MSSGVPINPPRRSHTYAAAELDDIDGLKTSIATSTTPVVYDADDFDGAAVANSGLGWAKFPRTVTISRSSSASSYTTDDIVITGKRGGRVVAETLTPANANGGDILRGTQAWDAPPSIAIPAQADTNGAFQIGVQDICTPGESDRFTMVVFRGTAGQLNLQYGDDPATASTDSFAAPADQHEVAGFSRVLTSPDLAAPTAQDLTVFQP